MKNNQPDYKTIYRDILQKKYPEKKQECLPLIREKKNLSVLDIIELNIKIFGTSPETFEENQKHRSYSKSDILKILDYQKKHNLNNIELARHFKLSRNTVAKWKKMFLV
ncbi:MAG: helix-turn-helix domain-containing protein [Bergeyella sp.]